MIPATLIALEGADQVGKETQTKLLIDALASQGFTAHRVEVPIKSIITYRLIYWMLKNGSAQEFPTLFQLVQFVNKLWFQLTTMKLLRWKYQYVVFDRWALSALVYGIATGVDPRLNRWLFDRLWCPDLTIVLLGSAHTDKHKDAYEADDGLQLRARKGYEVASVTVRDTVGISNQGGRELVHKQVMSVLDGRGML